MTALALNDAYRITRDHATREGDNVIIHVEGHLGALVLRWADRTVVATQSPQDPGAWWLCRYDGDGWRNGEEPSASVDASIFRVFTEARSL